MIKGSGIQFLTVAGAIASLGFAVASPTAQPQKAKEDPIPDKIQFNRDVRPILSQHCWPCHGTDKAAVARTGGLRLDSAAEATKDRGDSHFAIVPGKPEESLLAKRVMPKVPEMQMPPPGSTVEPLTDRQKQILIKWISQGAEYQQQWSFIPPVKAALPQVSDKTWPTNEIDFFILANLEKNGLTPAAEAPRTTLARRLSLALTGLPPSPQTVDSFVRDLSPKAYDTLVNRLLDDPHFGENQARYWLDAVRYGDTHGLHIDNYREIYPFRDWVVRALNNNLPYDQFVTQQLAGDLLPNPNLDQLIASGYVRMHVSTNEGGVIEEEFKVKNTVDRVDTTSTVFLGLTMACARCHDHKYDPISQADYYKFFAYFNSTEDPPLDGNIKNTPPVIRAPDPAQRTQIENYQSTFAQMEAHVDDKVAMNWLEDIVLRIPKVGAWKISGPYSGADFASTAKTAFDPEDPSKSATWRDIVVTDRARMDGVVGKENSAAYLKTTFTAQKESEYTIKVGSDDGIKIWLNGTVIHDNPVPRGLTVDQDTVKFHLPAGKNELLFKVTNGGGPDGFSISYGDEAFRLVGSLVKADSPLKVDKQTLALAKGLFLRSGPATSQSNTYRAVFKQYEALLATIPTTYVAKERAMPVPAYVLRRGEYDQRLEEVKRATPSALPAPSPSMPTNRLGLAQWLVAKENPLTARVFVNRIWQQFFGTGIVETSEDFGSQGSWPSNQALLDWLAVDFQENGWNVKRLIRQIVSSSAYRQSAVVTPQKQEIDPVNRLVSRGPRFRLDAEVLRDQALYASGLINLKMGGPGVRPYQPPGLWEALGFDISDTSRYVQDRGDALYRRSLYLFWKRTSPPPMMAIFDAPTRESCTVRRSRTNTPTQALASMNEPGMVEAARIMAERVLTEKSSQPERIAFAFKLVLGRTPSPKEADVLQTMLDKQLMSFNAHPERAEELLKTGEKAPDKNLKATDIAAYAMLCNTILNLDEALTIN